MDLKQMKLLLRDSYHSKQLSNCLVMEAFNLRKELHKLEDTVVDLNNRLRYFEYLTPKKEGSKAE